MKKVCAILLGILLITALPLTASAAGSSVSLTASAGQLQPGDEFSVEAVLENSDKIKLGAVVLEYDKEAFKFLGGECLISGTSIAQVIPDRNVGTFMIANGKTVSGKIFSFRFRVKETAKPGTYEITGRSTIGTTGGSPIDTKGAKIAIICNHTAGEEWHSSQTMHWHLCTFCQMKMDIADHNGLTEETACAVCGYKHSTSATQPEETVPGATLPDDTKPSQGAIGGDEAPDSTEVVAPEQTKPSQDTSLPKETVAEQMPSQDASDIGTVPEGTEAIVPEQTGTTPATTGETPANAKPSALWWLILIPVALATGATVFVLIQAKKKES